MSSHLEFAHNLHSRKGFESLLQLCLLLQQIQRVVHAQPGSTPLLLLLGVNPWCWLLQNTGLFCCDRAALSPVASRRFSSCCQASASWHDPFSLGPLSLHIHHWPLLASHSAQSCLFSMTPSCFQNQYPLGDSHITKFSGQHKVQPQPLLDHNLCDPTLSNYFSEDFTSVQLVCSQSLLIS